MNMEKKTLTAREIRESQFLLRAPLFAVPLLTVFFWAFGGGKGLASSGKGIVKGLLMRLPPPHVMPVTKLDKMGYYELAKKDSTAELEKKRIADHYARRLGLDDGSGDPVVRKVQEKLGELKLAMAGKRTVGQAGHGGNVAKTMGVRRVEDPVAVGMADRAMEKLQRMMNGLQRADGGNPEIAQLSAVLDKLVAVQRPRVDSGRERGLVPGRGTMTAERRVLLSVKAVPDEEDTLPGFDSSAIEAIIPDDQVLVSGGELHMELLTAIVVGGQRIPSGSELYGLVSLTGERLRVVVSGIAWSGRVLPVDLEVRDEDGLAGIYIPGAPVEDAVRESAGQELEAVGPTLLTTNLAGQAAGAGLNFARSLIGKKIRPVKVTIPAGYHVLLHLQNPGL